MLPRNVNLDFGRVCIKDGKVQIERSDDLIKADEAQYNADTGVLTAKDNVTYLNKDITINAIKGGYNSQTNTVSFNKATYKYTNWEFRRCVLRSDAQSFC